MRFIVLTGMILLILSFTSDLHAKKRKKRSYPKRKRPPLTQEAPMLPEEKKAFEDKFVYKEKYNKKYALGFYLFGIQADGVNDKNAVGYVLDDIQKAWFFGPGLIARIDLFKYITAFPRVSYSVIDKSKVYIDHTRDKLVGLFDIDLALRLGFYEDKFEVFIGGGGQLFYEKLEISYSRSAGTDAQSSTEDDFNFGASGGVLFLWNIGKEVSLFTSAKYYFIKPDSSIAGFVGAMIPL